MIYSVAEIQSILARELRDTPVKQAILFGSYAKAVPEKRAIWTL